MFDTDLGPLKLHFKKSHQSEFIERLRQQLADGDSLYSMVGQVQTGFAFNLGDQNGDGYEDSFSPIISSAPEPQSLKAGDFGLTAFDQDAQSGWLFILIHEAPQLWGQKTRLGTAEGPLEFLVYGDPLSNPQLLEIKQDAPGN